MSKRDSKRASGDNGGPKQGDGSVGYRRPPKKYRFKPGQSGNPKGRPKDCENLDTIVRRRLAQKISIRDGGKVRKVSVFEVAVVRLVEKAVQGDHRAIELLIRTARLAEPRKAEKQRNFADVLPFLSDKELADLERIVKRYDSVFGESQK